MFTSYKLVHSGTMGSLIAMGNNFQAKMQQWLNGTVLKSWSSIVLSHQVIK